MWYNLNFRTIFNEPIIFKDWEKKTVDFLDAHKNIKKVWLVNNIRKTGATTFAKLLLYFRPPCDRSFFMSNNLFWSKGECKHRQIEFSTNQPITKDGEWHEIRNFLTPVTLFGLEKEVEKVKENKNLINILMDLDPLPEPELYLECIYEREFKLETYKTLCSYDFDFFIVNVSPKDLEKARPFIEEDKNKEDVLIVEINETLLDPDVLENLKKAAEEVHI